MDQAKTDKQLKAILPEVIGAVITYDHKKINLCPVNFQAVASKYEQPLTVCIGLSNSSYSLQTILTYKHFVYAYPTPDQLKDIIYCGSVTGHTIDKLKNTELEFNKSMTIDPPNLQNAAVNFECILEHSYNAGNFTLVVAIVRHIVTKVGAQKIYSLGDEKYGTITTNRIIQEGR